MRATVLGLATLALAGFAAPADAAPMFGAPGLAPDAVVSQVRIVERRVVRGPRCKTVVTKRRGPLGRVTVVRKRRCF